MGKRIASIGYVSSDGKEITYSNDISREVFMLLFDSIKKIEAYYSILQFYPILIANERDLNDTIETVKKTVRAKLSKKWNGVDDFEEREMTLEVNRKLLNYLSSIRSFTDHIETFIKRQFGESSNFWRSYEFLKKSIYSSSFAYRFFYQLRDYAQHCGKPIECITWHAYSSYVPIVDVTILFKRDSLLEKFDSWKATKRDLVNMPETFKMENLLKELHVQLDYFYKEIKKMIKQEINVDIEIVKFQADKYRVNSNKVCIFYSFVKNKDGSSTYSQLNIPYEIIDDLMGCIE